MDLEKLLHEKHITRYRLSKKSGIPQSTIADICIGKTRIEKCSGDTLYRIAKALDMSMESLVQDECGVLEERVDFPLYRSSICHLVKDMGDVPFIMDVLSSGKVRDYYSLGWYPECFYLLAITDYLSRTNGIPVYTGYDEIRSHKLKKKIYPADVLLMDKLLNTDRNRKECLKKAIPEFLRFNIVESEIRDVD